MRAIGVVEWRDGLRDRLREELEALDDSVEVEELILGGNPATQLAGAASETDLLVVGSRGYGPLRRALVGGVSNRLMRASPAPVLIVPRAASP